MYIGLGFDSFFLSKNIIVGLFKRFREAGVKVIISHVSKNLVFSIFILTFYRGLNAVLSLVQANTRRFSYLKSMVCLAKILFSLTPTILIAPRRKSSRKTKSTSLVRQISRCKRV